MWRRQLREITGRRFLGFPHRPFNLCWRPQTDHGRRASSAIGLNTLQSQQTPKPRLRSTKISFVRFSMDVTVAGLVLMVVRPTARLRDRSKFENSVDANSASLELSKKALDQ
jgi:hypothetical protein